MTLISSKIRQLALTGAMLASALALSGCGFTPLYGQGAMSSALDDVVVELPTHSRAGYLVQQKVNDALGRHSDHGSWKLTLEVYTKRTARGVRVNNVASRYELNMTVDMVLTDAATGKVALKDTINAASTYDSADQPYAGLAAEQDGEVRAAGVAADLIRLRLSRYFAARPNP
jgi:LPS-assembly lipoprotein